MGGVSSMPGADEKHTQFWKENLKGSNHLENLGIYGRIISE